MTCYFSDSVDESQLYSRQMQFLHTMRAIPERLHDEALYKYTFTFTFTCSDGAAYCTLPVCVCM